MSYSFAMLAVMFEIYGRPPMTERACGIYLQAAGMTGSPADNLVMLDWMRRHAVFPTPAGLAALARGEVTASDGTAGAEQALRVEVTLPDSLLADIEALRERMQELLSTSQAICRASPSIAVAEALAPA